MGVAAQDPSHFKGLTLIVPCLELSEECKRRVEKYKPLAKMMNYVAPFYQFNDRKSGDIKPWLKNWAEDPLYQGANLSVHNLNMHEQCIKQFNAEIR